MRSRAFKRWKSDTQAHTDTSGRQLKITFFDVLDYSEYCDTNIRKKIRENIACSVRKQKHEKLYLLIFIHDGTLMKSLLDLWYLVWSLTSCASKSTSFGHWCTLYTVHNILRKLNWRHEECFVYRKLNVDYESWAVDPKIWLVYDAAKGERQRIWTSVELVAWAKRGQISHESKSLLLRVT